MQNKPDDQEELKRQIAYFRERVAWQATRGRAEGTYDHHRLRELEQALGTEPGQALAENPQGIDDSMEDQNANKDF